MTEYTSLLEEALEAWAYTREGVMDEVENLPEQHLGFRPTPHSRSVAELVQHILESGLLMSGELARPDGDFRRRSYEELLREHAATLPPTQSKAELIESLRRSHAEGEAKFRKAGELFMLQYIRRFDGQMGTRLAWMHHGISHEEYHRGQLALYARLLGEVPALTKLILGE